MLRHLRIPAVLILALSPTSYAESTISCPAGQIDMLDWLTLDADLRSSKHMSGASPIYTVVSADKFYWLKTSSGDTWDINLYNGSMIYLWVTENEVWHTPYNYKKSTFNYNFPMAPRCATPGKPGSTILVSNTSYTPAVNCVEGTPRALGKAVLQVWGPYTAGQPGLEPSRPPIGGDVANSTPVHVVGYLYNCDNSYGNCQSKEEYILTQRYGLVRWNLWTKSGSGFSLSNRTTFNTLTNGTTTPFFPCF